MATMSSKKYTILMSSGTSKDFEVGVLLIEVKKQLKKEREKDPGASIYEQTKNGAVQIEI